MIGDRGFCGYKQPGDGFKNGGAFVIVPRYGQKKKKNRQRSKGGIELFHNIGSALKMSSVA